MSFSSGFVSFRDPTRELSLPATPPPAPPGAARAAAVETDVIDLEVVNQRLLDAIATGDFLTYSCLVADDLTCFEPEACGHLVEGVGFHKYYFDLLRDDAAAVPSNATMVAPRYRVLGDTAIVAYVRVVQRGRSTTRCEETRVWRRVEGDSALTKWRLVHFHRSAPANAYGS